MRDKSVAQIGVFDPEKEYDITNNPHFSSFLMLEFFECVAKAWPISQYLALNRTIISQIIHTFHHFQCLSFLNV